MITANRRASATIASFIPRCLAIFIAQALSQDHFAERISRIWAAYSEIVAKCQKQTHAPQHGLAYSTTSSARANSGGGTSRPSALAVLRLICSSYFVGC